MKETQNIVEVAKSTSSDIDLLESELKNDLNEKKIKETSTIEVIFLNALGAQVKMERQVYGLGISGLLTIVGFIVVLNGAKEIGLLAFAVGFFFSIIHAIQIDRYRKFKFKILRFKNKINDELINKIKNQCDPKALEDLLKWINKK